MSTAVVLQSISTQLYSLITMPSLAMAMIFTSGLARLLSMPPVLQGLLGHHLKAALLTLTPEVLAHFQAH